MADNCRIFEYDGAFKCVVHDRLWGAVSNPDEPCIGHENIQPEPPGNHWHERLREALKEHRRAFTVYSEGV